MSKQTFFFLVVLGAHQITAAEPDAIVSTFSSASSSSQEMVNGKVVRKSDSNESAQDQKAFKNGEVIDHRSANDSAVSDIDNIKGTHAKVTNSGKSEKTKNKKARRARMVTGEFALQSVEQQEAAQEGYISEQQSPHVVEAVMQSAEGDILFISSANIWNYVDAQEAFEDAQELFRVDFSPETAFNVAHDIVQGARAGGCEEAMNLVVIAAR